MPALFKKTSSSAYYSDEFIVGLDLGTSKITTVVAEREPSGEATIIGIGQAPSQGIRKGHITNLEQVTRSIREAVDRAENIVGNDLKDVTVAFSGADVRCEKTQGNITLGRQPRAVTDTDIKRVIDQAQVAVPVQENQTILQTIPVMYSLDGRQVDEPLGMTGMNLTLELISVIVPTATVQNVLNCVEKAGLNVVGFVIKPLASALGTLRSDESDMGTAVVDFGGGTCGVAVFSDRRLRHIAVIAFGGNHITSDVSTVLNMPSQKAEEIKKEADLISEEALAHSEPVSVEYDGRTYSFSLPMLIEVIQERLKELFDVFVRKELEESGLKDEATGRLKLPNGMMLTGGVSRSIGIDAFLADVLHMQVRMAVPVDSSRMPPKYNGPEYACACGIIRYVLEKENNPNCYIDQPMEMLKPGMRGGSRPTPKPDRGQDGDQPKKQHGGGILQSIKDILGDMF